jgi:hypothetical protein
MAKAFSSARPMPEEQFSLDDVKTDKDEGLNSKSSARHLPVLLQLPWHMPMYY